LQELQESLSVLQNRLERLLACIQDNDVKQTRFHALESRLLALTSLHELIQQTIAGAQGTFDLEAVSLWLADEAHELRRFLQDDGIAADRVAGLRLADGIPGLEDLLAGRNGKPYLGPYRDSPGALLFGADDALCAGSMAVLPLRRRGRLLGSLNLASGAPDRFGGGLATDFLDRLARILAVCLENTLNFELLRRASLRDVLTGVNNRRFFDQRLDEEIARVARSRECLSCLFLDIDHFKRINDAYGHQAGDLVLVAVAHCIRTQLRNNDVLARYGGEEFVALLAVAAESDAREIAERIRAKVAAAEIKQGCGNRIGVTLSIGIATLDPAGWRLAPPQTSRELLAAADRALYRAKEDGRNRVISDGVLAAETAAEQRSRRPASRLEPAR